MSTVLGIFDLWWANAYKCMKYERKLFDWMRNNNKDRTETINDLWAGWEPDELNCYIFNENVTR